MFRDVIFRALCTTAAALLIALGQANANAQVKVWEGTMTLPSSEEGAPDENPPFDLFATRRLTGAAVGLVGLIATWRIARHRPKSERWKVLFGRRREQIQRANTARLGIADDSCHKRATDAVRTPFGHDRYGTQQRVSAANLEAGDANHFVAGAGDDEIIERFSNAGNWQVAPRQQRLDVREIAWRYAA